MAKKHEDVEEQAATLEAEAVENAEAAPCCCPAEDAVDAIIRKRVYAAIGVGFVPVPLVDFAALTAVQLEMIHALSKAHGVEFKKERVKSIISALCGGVLTTASVPLAASLFKSIPIIGFTAGAATISIMGGSSTYALGWVFDRHFRKGGTLGNFDVNEAKAYFKTKMEEGKGMVSKMKQKIKKSPADAEEPKAEEQAATPA
ncbi:MAG: YcjF family protein [Halodesulfovibrio sp.]